jgi:hypothetical protein
MNDSSMKGRKKHFMAIPPPIDITMCVSWNQKTMFYIYFKSMQAKQKNQLNRKIKKLRLDYVETYISSGLSLFCVKYHIYSMRGRLSIHPYQMELAKKKLLG